MAVIHTSSVLIVIACLVTSQAEDEAAIRVARCRASCVEEFCSLPAHHYAVTLSPVSGECWSTCMRLYQGQGRTYLCEDPENYCQTSGCQQACRTYWRPLKHRPHALDFPHSPVVTVLSNEWVKILWSAPRSKDPAVRAPALTYLLSWQPENSASQDWIPFDITVSTEGEFHRSAVSAEGERILPARVRITAVEAQGLVAQTELGRERFIHVSFPSDTPATKPTPTTTTAPERSEVAPSVTEAPKAIDTVSFLASLEAVLRTVFSKNESQSTEESHEPPVTQPSSLQYLLIPAAVGVVSVLLLLLLVTVSTCQLKRLLRTAHAHRQLPAVDSKPEAEPQREEGDGCERSYAAIDLYENMLNISALLDEDDIALEKLMSDPKQHYMLTIDPDSSLLGDGLEEDDYLTTGYLTMETNDDTVENQLHFIPRYG